MPLSLIVLVPMLAASVWKQSWEVSAVTIGFMALLIALEWLNKRSADESKAVKDAISQLHAEMRSLETKFNDTKFVAQLRNQSR